MTVETETKAEAICGFSRHPPRAVLSVLGALTQLQATRISDIYRKSKIGRIPVAEILAEAKEAALVTFHSIGDGYRLTENGGRCADELAREIARLDEVASPNVLTAETHEHRPPTRPVKLKPVAEPHQVVVRTELNVTIAVDEAIALLLAHHYSMSCHDGPNLAAMVGNGEATATMKFIGRGKVELCITTISKR